MSAHIKTWQERLNAIDPAIRKGSKEAAKDAEITDLRAALATQSSARQAANGEAQVDWLGLALDLEAQATRVESQTTERAMLSASNGLRLMGPKHSLPSVPVIKYDMMKTAYETELAILREKLTTENKAAGSTTGSGVGAAPVGEAVRDALQTIARWTLPATGKTWDDGTSMSYGACYGSNGERDYMRQIALDALAALAAPSPHEAPEAGKERK